MDWQLLIVGVLVFLALAYLGRRTLRAWRLLAMYGVSAVSISAVAPSSSPYTQTTGTVAFQAGQNITVSQPLTLTALAIGIMGNTTCEGCFAS